MGAMRRFVLVASVLCVFCLAAYWRVLSADFINFDDDVYVYENVHVAQGLSAEGIGWAFGHPVGSIYQPLTMLSLMLDAEVWGVDPFGFHLTNLLLHVLNCLLLLWVLQRLTGSFWRSAFAVALFALHPLRVESVAWVTERKDVLSGTFFMLTLAAWRCWVSGRGPWRYGLAFVSLALGLLAKQTLAFTPLVLLLLDWWPLGRHGACVRGAGQPGEQARTVWQLLLEKAPFLLLGLGFGLLALYMVAGTGSAASFDVLPPGARVENALVAYVRYLGKLFWPAELLIFYPHPEGSTPLWQVVSSAALLAGITAAAIWQARRRPYLFVGWFWFCLMLLPMSGLLQAGSHAMADRFTYLPMIGLFVALSWAAGDLAERIAPSGTRRALLFGSASLVVAVLGTLTFRQTAHWKDSLSVYRHALDAGAEHHFLYNNMGLALLEKGRLDQAARSFGRAIDLAPENARAHMNLGLVYSERGLHERAVRMYEKAIQFDPGYADAYDNLAIALYQQGKYQTAWDRVTECLERGGRPHPGFLRALAREHPPPDRARALLDRRSSTR